MTNVELIEKVRSGYFWSGDAVQLANALEAAEKRIAELENAMTDINEYWNGNETDTAMVDALGHILNVSKWALGSTAKKKGEK